MAASSSGGVGSRWKLPGGCSQGSRASSALASPGLLAWRLLSEPCLCNQHRLQQQLGALACRSHHGCACGNTCSMANTQLLGHRCVACQSCK